MVFLVTDIFFTVLSFLKSISHLVLHIVIFGFFYEIVLHLLRLFYGDLLILEKPVVVNRAFSLGRRDEHVQI